MNLSNDEVRVVQALIENPRASYNEIADVTDVPKSTVWYIKKRLEDDELLQTLVFMNVGKLDDCKIGLVGGTVNGDKEVVLSDVASHPNVWFLVDTIGPHAFTAGIVGKNSNDFQRSIDDLREMGAEGDHYGEVINIQRFGLSSEFVKSLESQ